MDKRESVRVSLRTQIEFFIDADIIQADSVDISDGGVRLTMPQPFQIKMRVKMEDHYQERPAQLVWAKRHNDSGMECGLEFIGDPVVYKLSGDNDDPL